MTPRRPHAEARETGAIAILEEHSVIGGLGSAVAEVLAEADGVHVPLRRIGLPSSFWPHIGSQECMQARRGLEVDSLVRNLEEFLEKSEHPLVGSAPRP